MPEDKYNKILEIIPGYNGHKGIKHKELVDKTPLSKYYDTPIKKDFKFLSKSGIYISHKNRPEIDKVGGFKELTNNNTNK